MPDNPESGDGQGKRMKHRYGNLPFWFIVIVMGLFLSAGCGSKGSKATEGGDDGGGGDPTPTFNFTGTVFNGNGNNLPQVDIHALQGEESSETTVTNANGQFSMNIPEDLHTVLGSRPGFISMFRLADLSAADAVEQTLLLRTALASSASINGQTGGSVTSNAIDGDRAQLNVPAQPEGVFGVSGPEGRTTASSATMSIEYIDLTRPLPVPLPSPDTLAADDVTMGGKQTPSVMVSITPSLLSMDTPGELNLPNPDGLSNAPILHFNPYEHRWVVVGTTDDTPGAGTSLSVSEGGVYGIFHQESRTATVRGTASPGSYIYVGDDVIRVLADGSFYAGEVPVPANGQLEIVAIGPDGEVIEKTEQDLSPGDVITVALSIVELSEISVTAGDEQIAADGETTTVINATVLDANREAALDGTEVVFSTTAGTLLCAADSVGCNETLGGVKAQTSNGIAQAVLRSNSVIGTATVTAIAEDLTGDVSVEFVAGLPDSADVTANPLNLTANGSQTSTINAVVYDATGRRLEGRSILFSLDSSDIEEPSDMGRLDQPVATTSQAGIASVVYTAPTKTGTVTISVSDEESGNLLGSVDITLIEALVANVEPSTGADSIIADGKKVLVAATVTDFDGNAVSDGTVVTFNTSAGTFEDAKDVDKTLVNKKTTGGRATANLISPTNVGTANITITAGGVWATTSVDFVPGAPASITASASPSKLTVGQDESSTITVTVRDRNNNLVPGATVLIGNNAQPQDQSQILYGSLDTGTAVTDANGRATFQYTPPSLVPEEGKDVIIVQTTSAISATVEVQLEGPRIAGIVLSVEPESLPADGESQAIVSATLTLVGGDPAPEDTPVFFEVVSGGGSFTNDITQSFTVEGEAIARLTSGTVPGTATVRVGTDKFEDAGGTEKVGGIVQEIEIEYTPGSIILSISPNVVLGINPDSCDGDAVYCSEITANIENTSGEPAVGEEVVFSLDGSAGMSIPGRIWVKDGFRCPDNPNENVGCSDDEGKVEAFFLPPNDGGEVTVTATWETGGVEVTETGTITVSPPPAAINVVPPDLTEISVRGTGGQETVQLFFDVKDNEGNPVVEGYRIDFEILTGPGGGETVTPIFDLTDANGTVGTVLRSGFKSGPVSIKATYFNNSNVSTVMSQVVIKAGPPVGEAFGISAQYNNISGLTISYLADVLTANVVDYYGNAVPDGTAVSFKTYNTGGLIEEGDQNTSTTGGTANSTLFSTPAPSPIQGFVSVTSETIGGRTTHVTSIDLVPVDFAAKDRYVVFAGTDGGGVYKSLDSGKTWENRSRSSEHPGQNWIGPYVNDISIDRDEANTVYAATGYSGDGNVYRSLDGGLTWNSGSAEEWNGLRSYPSSDLYSKLNSAVSVVLCDYDDSAVPYQNFPYVWVGSEDDGVFFSADGVIFTQAEDLDIGRKINEIVRVSNTHYEEDAQGNVIDEAILYAATSSGVYKSFNSGRNWFYNEPQMEGIPNPFFGDHINALVLHPSSDGDVSDILYAGTEDAGVWVSTDSGKSWKNYKEGLGEGLMATIPVADKGNTGTGRIADVTVGKKTLSENWTLEYEEYQKDGETKKGFTITGSDTGVIPDPNNPEQPDHANVGSEPYKVDTADISFIIEEGSVPFAVGDSFTFTTIRNPGLNIKELLLDETNKRLYAVTYFEPENFHAVGNLYYHELDSDGSGFMREGSLWVEANEGLPQFDPPDDETLFAQHAMALIQGTFGNTKSLLIGGEGINFYKADAGLDTPDPDWQSSKSGLDNTIMARRPVLFSGTAFMDVLVAEIRDENGNVRDNECYVDCENPYDPSTCDMSDVCSVNEVSIFEGDFVVFHIYAQDWNGNPPLAGSSLSEGIGCVTSGEQGVELWRVFGNSLLQRGTQSDPDNPETAFPFIYQAFFPTCDTGSSSKLRIEFNPLCEADSPGCSFGTPGGDNRQIFRMTAIP